MSSNGKQKKRKGANDRKEHREQQRNQKCVFCLSGKCDSLRFGKMIKFGDIYVHYYCLLLSSGLEQKGRDSEGIYGFLVDDIRREERRGEKLKCSYCKSNGATIGCSVKSCKISFHLPCGQTNKAMHQFFDKFDSYCLKHRPKQTLESTHELNDSCPTCYESLTFDEGIDVLDTPCCHNLIHRLCLQKQALSAGYFFKCPLCNNESEFRQTMRAFGIYRPKMDASWEQENNAYGSLYQRHSRCDQEVCLSPNGRLYTSQSGSWQLLVCETCGSKGTHWACVGCTQWVDVWNCDECDSVEHRLKKRRFHSYDGNESDDSDSSSGVEVLDTSTTNSVAHPSPGTSIRRTSITLSTNSNQSFEINVLKELTTKKMRNKYRNRKAVTKVETKDVEIQCELVDKNDLIDSDPIDELDEYVIGRKAIIGPKEDKEVIDIESDDDNDDCVVID